MMKRLVSLMLACVLLLMAAPALADQPQPIETIPYEELPEPFDGQHHYLLLCVDQWYGKPGNLGNTDGIVLVTVDTRAHRVMLTSFIRDALVERPDGKIGRINYIAKNYGPEALCKVISQHIGVKVEKISEEASQYLSQQAQTDALEYYKNEEPETIRYKVGEMENLLKGEI